jgi:hypothetical protein
VLKQYFGYYDIFDVTEGERDDVMVNYGEDYFDFIVTNYTLKERAKMYQLYLHNTSRKTEYVEVDYRLQVTDSYYISQSQLPQYEYAIKQFDKIALPSDGIGLASVYCILHDIDYVSWEPNQVGSIARQLGIITSDSPIYDESRYYLFFYCVQYYTVPMFLGQCYVVWDVVSMKKPGKLLMPEVSTNTLFDVKEWQERYISRYMVIDSYYPLDESSRQMMRNLQVRETTISEAQFLVSSSQNTVEVMISIGFYTEEYQKEYRKKEHKIQGGFKKNKKNKENKEQVKIDENFISEIKNRTLIITEKSFPFREIYGHRPGRLKVYKEKYLDRHYGSDRAMEEGYMSSINNMIGLGAKKIDYEIVQGVFVVKLQNPSIIRHLFLRVEHVGM